ncbi:MAG: FkbM family methyltransferase [Planctomycetaceae bacterium]|nr:FkbM family methyltransferase [Planctomycetaceae bacterium]
MSVYALERIRQIMDSHIGQALSPLVVNTEATERVESWLEDEASRHSYRRELAFMVLRGLLRDDYATVNLVGNVKLPDWDKVLKDVADLRASGKLPEIDYPPSADWVVPWMYASNFILDQYAYGDAVRPTGVFLDCGACCGETAVWALGCGAQQVYAFEPNPEAFGYLQRNAEKFGGGRVVPVQRGVGEAPGLMSLKTEDGNIGDTRFNPNAQGGTSIPIVTLDGWCRENRVAPDFIKMDLEGWETAALRGGRSIIAEHRPRLAVCLYHSLADMWTIPHLIKEICPSYRFWCRKNAPYAEFVLYAACR